MSIELYPNIAKVKRNGVYQNLPGFAQTSGDTDIEAMIANSETSTTAQFSHDAGSYFILDGVLYQADDNIAVNDIIAVGTNCHTVVLANELSDVNNKINNVNNSINRKIDNSLKAYIIETQARNFWIRSIIPTAFQDHTKYDDGVALGNPYFKISGSRGNSYVTVINGGNAETSDISSYTNKWAAVISYDGINFETCLAWYIDTTTIGVYPPLKDDIASGELGSQWYDSMHLTRRGYIGYVQAIFKANPKHCEKKSYIEKWVAGDTIPFSQFGGAMYASTDQNFNYENAGFLYANKFLQYKKRNTATSATSGNRGIRWEVNLSKKTGYAEIMIGGIGGNDMYIPSGNEIYIDFYGDGVLKQQYVKNNNILECIYIDYENIENAKIEIYLKNQAANGINGSGFRLSSIYFWENERENADSLFPAGVVAGQMFDSWGVYHDNATAVEFQRLISAKTGVTVPYTNHSLGGSTSAWGKAWFYENLQQYNPKIGLVDFGINDANSTSVTGFPATVEGPDGTVYDNIIDRDEYAENMQIIANEAKANGIQIIMMAEPRENSGLWYYALADNIA